MFDETNLRKAHKEMLFFSYVMIFSLVVYAGLVELFLRTANIGTGLSVPGYFRYIIMAVAAVEVVVMIIIKNRILSGETKIAVQSSPPSDEAAEQPEAKEKEFIQRLRSAHIISYAFCETFAIFGLVLFILEKDKTEFYAFLGVAFFLMLVNFPKYDDWKSRMNDFLSDF